MSVRILTGDCRETLLALEPGSIDCCVTSPPYFGLRSYLQGDHPDKGREIGLEPTPAEFVAALVETFRAVRRVLREDGTLWVNLGDSYAGSWGAQSRENAGKHAPNVSALSANQVKAAQIRTSGTGILSREPGLKQKDLIGIPWRVAFALQDDGWWWRQWLPWVKRNPMPESTRDRPTSACEVWLMFTKAQTYHYDYEAVRRAMAPASEARLAQDVDGQTGSTRANGGAKTNGTMKAVGGDKQRGHSRRHAGVNDRWDKMERDEQRGERAFRNSDLFFDSLTAPHGAICCDEGLIALDIATQPFRDAHYATFPPSLIYPLIKASCRPGGTVLDPFGGAGTTGLVADRLQRNAVLCELLADNAEMAARRIRAEAGLMAQVTVETAPITARGAA
jgi:DNA modification methylase